MSRVAALLLAAAALAGCAALEPKRDCASREPLILQAYPQVGNPDVLAVQTSLWNCTDRTLANFEPCVRLEGIPPRFDHEGETFVLTVFGTTAIPLASMECSEFGHSGDYEPGAYLEQVYRWDGNLTAGNETRPFDGDAVEFYVQAGHLRVTKEVAVPWPRPT